MRDLDTLSLPELFRALTVDGALVQLVELAWHEDLDDAGDLTTASLDGMDRAAVAQIVSREAGVVAGLAAVPMILDRFTSSVTFKAKVADGVACGRGQTLGVLRGPLDEILRAERTILNLVGRLSGIATLTQRFVERVAGTKVAICATRKTTPGLRAMEKYAVACGGGTLHRLGLYDAALYKDNHLAHVPLDAWSETIRTASARVRATGAVRFIEVEVDTLDQLDRVLDLPVGSIDIVLLDNMTPAVLRDAVARRARIAPSVQLEASGGIDLDSIAAVAKTGVDRVSVGALTHSAAHLDVGLDIAAGEPDDIPDA